MNVDPRDGFEDHLRGALARRAAALSAPADVTAPGAVAAAARSRRTRRQWGAAALALVVVLAASVGVVVAGGGSPRQTVAGPHLAPGQRLDRHDGVLVLPLSGTVSESPRRDSGRGGSSEIRGFNGVAPGVSGDALAQGAAKAPGTVSPSAGAPTTASTVPTATTAPTVGPIDVAPSASASLQRLFAHTSPDGVQATAFDQPGDSGGDTGGSGGDTGGSTVPTPPPTEVGPAETVPASGPVSPPAVVGPSIAVAPSVSPTSSTTRPASGSGPASSFGSPLRAGSAAGSGAPSSSSGPAVVVPPIDPVNPVPSGCLTTTQLTLEISDTAAVGTVTEPLFSGATGALVQVQVGEIGNAEGAPATWVMAQVGKGAATVEVQFADGTIDHAAVPSSGVVVLGHKGSPTDALGNGSVAAIDVLDATNTVLAGYGLGTTTSVPADGNAPSKLPAPGSVQPADPAAATAAVSRAVETALGCRASPLQRFQAVAGGDPIEVVPSFGGDAVVNVDKVVFTSATTAVAQYRLAADQGQQQTGAQYAAATLHGSTWQLSLASVAPGIQVTPANQVGNVTVAPGGPLFVHSWPGGTAVAVYKALPGSQSSPGYGTGEAACTPAGGIVEEVTTPDAVGVVTSALFPNYATPLISAAVSVVGGAEGSPATVVDVEVGPQASSVSVTGSGGTVTEAPAGGEAVIVLAGDPTATLGGADSRLQVSDSTGAALGTVSLQVDANAPAGPESVPPSLPPTPPAGTQGPADPQAATAAITAAFSSVFDCKTPPIQRVDEIQDGSLVAGALEQLDTGPYEALASSTYIDVTGIVFESPTLADVSYTLLFHSDAGLKFAMTGQAIVVAGNWRVTYGTVCAAIQLGLGNCQT